MMITVLPPAASIDRRQPPEPKKQTPELPFRIGQCVVLDAPKRCGALDRVEQQVLDPEVELLCSNGAVGRVIRCAPHSVVVECALTANEYFQLYPAERLAIPAMVSPATNKIVLDGEEGTLEGDTAAGIVGNKSDTTNINASEEGGSGLFDIATTSAIDNEASSKAHNSVSTRDSGSGMAAASTALMVSDDAASISNDIIIARKTLPLSYVKAVHQVVEEGKQKEIKAAFANQNWTEAKALAQQLINDIINIEGVEVSDTTFHHVYKDHFVADNGAVTSTDRIEGDSLLSEPPTAPTPSLKGLPPLLVPGGCQNSMSLASYYRTTRVAAIQQLLSNLYITVSASCLHLSQLPAAISAGKRAVLLDPLSARAYAAVISAFHATGGLVQSSHMLREALGKVPVATLEDCQWFKSVQLLDTVYRIYTPLLEATGGNQGRSQVEVTVNRPESESSHLALLALRDFGPDEPILTECPTVWLPWMPIETPPTSSTGRRQRTSSFLSPSPVAGREASPSPSSNRSATTPVLPPERQSQCMLCGFVFLDRTAVIDALKEAKFHDAASAFANRYPARTKHSCRHECGEVFCSEVCEERAWTSFHQVDCAKGGLLTPEHQQNLRIAVSGNSSPIVDTACRLFLRVSLMLLCDVDAALTRSKLDVQTQEAECKAFIATAVKAALERVPIIPQLVPPNPNIPSIASSVMRILSVSSPRNHLIADELEIYAAKVFNHCLMTHRVVDRCPLTSVLKAVPRAEKWPNVCRPFIARQVCLFPVIGCAQTFEQKSILDKAGVSIADNNQLSVGTSLFDICSDAGSFSDLESSPAGGGPTAADFVNTVIESAPNDLGIGSFTLRCASGADLGTSSELFMYLQP